MQLRAFAKLVSVWVKPEVLEHSLLGRVGDSHGEQSLHYSPFNCGGSLGTPFQEQGPNPLAAGTLQRNNLQAGPPPAAGSPWHAQCPAIVLLWPPALSSPASSSPRAPQLDPTSAGICSIQDGDHMCCEVPRVSEQWHNEDTFLPQSLGVLLLDPLCHVLAAIPACSQPDREILPASSSSQSSSATQFASWGTAFFPHAQIKRQCPRFPSSSGLNCSRGQTGLCRGMISSWGFLLFPLVLTSCVLTKTSFC